MGMFNIIKSREKCFKCGRKIDEWQSKELRIKGYLIENLLENIVLDKDMGGEMHTFCEKCSTYIEYQIIKGKIVKNHKGIF